jgi:hypothetical protein
MPITRCLNRTTRSVAQSARDTAQPSAPRFRREARAGCLVYPSCARSAYQNCIDGQGHLPHRIRHPTSNSNRSSAPRRPEREHPTPGRRRTRTWCLRESCHVSRRWPTPAQKTSEAGQVLRDWPPALASIVIVMTKLPEMITRQQPMDIAFG